MNDDQHSQQAGDDDVEAHRRKFHAVDDAGRRPEGPERDEPVADEDDDVEAHRKRWF